jgi:hypothetical protein
MSNNLVFCGQNISVSHSCNEKIKHSCDNSKCGLKLNACWQNRIEYDLVNQENGRKYEHISSSVIIRRNFGRDLVLSKLKIMKLTIKDTIIF